MSHAQCTPAPPASLLFAFAVALAPTWARADGPFSLKDGDRVVFYGDSITDQRLYTTFVEAFVATRFPRMKVDFVHSGWGGDSVSGGGGGPIDVGLDRDVIVHKPTVVTIMLGMNDAAYQPFDQKVFDTYAEGYRHIVDKLRRDLPGLRLTLIGPSPFDDVCRPPTFEGGYNAVLVRYGEFVKVLASEKRATFADLNRPVVEATRKAFAADAELAGKLNPDRVHPDIGGQLLMAAALLKAWNAPAIVSAVEIDAGGGSAAPRLKSEAGAKTSSLVGDAGRLGWIQVDDGLPFPIDYEDPATRLAVRSSTLLDDLDRQGLRVVNLEKPRYTLKIDGKDVGTFSKEDLAGGSIWPIFRPRCSSRRGGSTG